MTLRLAWRNLWRHSRRTGLTTGAMVFSNILLIFMISLQFGTYRMMIDNTLQAFTGHLQIQAPGYNDEPKMRKSIAGITQLSTQLRESPAIKNHAYSLAARASGFALASSSERSFGIQIIGVQPDYEKNVSNIPGLIKEGRYLQASPSHPSAHSSIDEIVVGRVLARNLKLSLGDELTLLGSGRDGSFAAAVVTVVGIFESGITDLDRSVAQMTLRNFQNVFSMGDHGHSIAINTNDLSVVNALSQQLSTQLTSLRPDVTVLDWDELQPGLKQAIQADIASAWFMYGVLIILVAFSVLNTQLMSVLERTREFGINLSLGLTPGRLGRLVILETTLMATIGLVLGVLLGLALTAWLSVVGFYYPGMEEMAAKFNLEARMYPEISVLSILLGPGFIFFASVLASLYPALRIHLLQPVTAMRAA